MNYAKAKRTFRRGGAVVYCSFGKRTFPTFVMLREGRTHTQTVDLLKECRSLIARKGA